MGVPKGRVLVIDNDLFLSTRIISVLRHQGYSAERAANAEAALQKVAVQSFDFAMVALESQRADGFDIVRKLKVETVPKVIGYISHTKIPEIRDRARDAGIDRICANSAVTMRLPQILAALGRGESLLIDDSEE